LSGGAVLSATATGKPTHWLSMQDCEPLLIPTQPVSTRHRTHILNNNKAYKHVSDVTASLQFDYAKTCQLRFQLYFMTQVSALANVPWFLGELSWAATFGAYWSVKGSGIVGILSFNYDLTCPEF